MSADLNELEKRMHGAMDALKKEFGGLRTGRASVNLLDPVNFSKIASLGSVLFTPAYQNLWTPELMAAEPNLATIKQAVDVVAADPGFRP